MISNGKTVFYTTEEGIGECRKLGIKRDIGLMETGGTYNGPGTVIEAVPCDHKELSKDAVGLILKFGRTAIYVAGDTAFRPDHAAAIARHSIDLMIMPINGAYGNLDENESVKLCSIIKPKLAVPCHYWNFAEHGGDPGLFAVYMKKMLPDQEYVLMAMGSHIFI
jgi:L-ascorbate 6-phosphate lactonase